MNRIIYVAGVNRKHLAEAADSVPYWLLSATLLRNYPSWLDNRLKGRKVRWDPGTFSEDAICYTKYRSMIDRFFRSSDDYLQYDEIGDEEATAWYLRDMRRRGYKPIPVLQGKAFHLLRQEPLVAIGGLVRLQDAQRRSYLDEIFYDHKPVSMIHLLGMIKHEWFEPYETATCGDNTSWIPRDAWNRKKSIEEWMKEYGVQNIPFKPRNMVQMALGF